MNCILYTFSILSSGMVSKNAQSGLHTCCALEKNPYFSLNAPVIRKRDQLPPFLLRFSQNIKFFSQNFTKITFDLAPPLSSLPSFSMTCSLTLLQQFIKISRLQDWTKGLKLFTRLNFILTKAYTNQFSQSRNWTDLNERENKVILMKEKTKWP